ncbi:MAG: DegT/DnrJ/EryC1/StrS family aminotransferase [Kiritimatiellae bacterium]|nr:DegT/DnrJ/EryC1/StrS family aminotransferase [Kiritimatiellia bacterium]
MQQTLQRERLALDGGRPVRAKPLPPEWCGAHHMDGAELAAVERVVRARSPFRYYGLALQREAEQFEREFAAYLGVKHALGVNSGTAALQAALAALGVGFGDEVVLPGYFWVSTVAAVVRSGAIPVLVDSDATWSIDPDKVEAKITERTKAIITVHMGGVIGRVAELVRIARRHGLPVLEDCAQAAGASQNGRKAGTFGDIAIFSFQLNKHMTAGEGGMVVTNEAALYRRAFAVHDLGYFRNAAGRLEFSDPDAQLWGIGARMSELTAAVARVQLAKLDGICRRMRTAKNRIKAALADLPGVRMREVLDPAGDAGSFLYLTFATRAQSLRFVEGVRAEGIVAAEGGMYPIHFDDWGLHIYYNIPSLVAKKGIGARSVWDLAENAGSDVSYGKGTCPVLDSRLARSVVMCVASNLTDDDVADIVAAFRKVGGEVA